MVRQLPVLPETQIIDIFKRINRNTVSLNRQELRHATYWGEFIESMESISDDPLWEDLNIFSANDIRRMSDVEFVSELAIAYLHGHQNKKASLDRYYVVYEKEFDQRKEVEAVFRIVLSETSAILSGRTRSRWRKKSDFYSLFLVLAEYSDSFPLSAAKRNKATSSLQRFGEQVDEYLRSDESSVSKAAARYAHAVERAASDLANRRIRHDVLLRLLKFME